MKAYGHLDSQYNSSSYQARSLHKSILEETWGAAAVLVCEGILAGGVEEGVKDEEEEEEEVKEEEEDNFVSAELSIVLKATELLTATLQVAVAVAPVAVPSDSISQAEIPSSDCTARLASHRVPFFHGVWQ